MRKGNWYHFSYNIISFIMMLVTIPLYHASVITLKMGADLRFEPLSRLCQLLFFIYPYLLISLLVVLFIANAVELYFKIETVKYVCLAWVFWLSISLYAFSYLLIPPRHPLKGDTNDKTKQPISEGNIFDKQAYGIRGKRGDG